MEEIKRIYLLLLENDGLRLRDIAEELELDKYHLAELMFSEKCNPYWYQNDFSLWFAKEGAIVRMHLGIGQDKMSLDDIGKALGFTKERARQQFEKAKRILKGFIDLKRMQEESNTIKFEWPNDDDLRARYKLIQKQLELDDIIKERIRECFAELKEKRVKKGVLIGKTLDKRILAAEYYFNNHKNI